MSPSIHPRRRRLLDRRPRPLTGPWRRGVARALGATGIALLATALAAPAASAGPIFSAVAAPTLEARFTPVAATLPDGKVLIADGRRREGSLVYPRTVELFNPATSAFEPFPGEVNEGRAEAAFATLADGRVLIAGGYNEAKRELDSAELFDPATGSFTTLPMTLGTKRDGPAAARLPNGKVLIVGGFNEPEPEKGRYLKSAELFNPATGGFEALPAAMAVGRYEAAAAPLPDGQVLIVGGFDEPNKQREYLASAELFDPTTNTFEPVAARLTEARGEMAFTVLQDGDVLLAGGANETAQLGSAELFDPAVEAFARDGAMMSVRREGAAAALLPDGQVLIVDGTSRSSSPSYLRSAELTLPASAATTAPASAITASGATLDGTARSEAIGGYHFEYGTTTSYGSSTVPAALAATPVALPASTALSGLQPETTYHFRLVVENAGGTARGSDQSFTTAAQRPGPRSGPTLTDLRESHRRFRDGRARARISRTHRRPRRARHARAPVGTTFSFMLNERAAVTLRFLRVARGREVGRRCAVPTSRNRRHRRCDRAVRAGRLELEGHAGLDTVTFDGVVAGSHRLKPGRYAVVIEATSAAGTSRPEALRFTVVK